MIILDASVAVRWFVAEENGRDRALEILDEIKKAPERFAVPDLFYVEMMNVLSRLVKNSSELQRYVQGLFDLGLVQIRVGSKLLERASEIAVKYKLSGYDALYAAVAQSLKGHWITGDSKAHSKIEALKISRII